MKTLLIRPPSKHIENSAKPAAALPLGLLYIAAVLEKNNIPVEIYDAQINVKMPVYRDLNGDRYMGDRWESVEENIARRRPDIIGITCPFTTQIESAIRTAEIAKKVNSNIITVIGGNHASTKPEDFLLKTSSIDIVCIGEGEYTLSDIIESLRSKKNLKDIPGTAIRDGEKIRINQVRPYIQNLDELPLPAYHLINMENYFRLYKNGFSNRINWPYPGSEKTVTFISSRGCPFNCIFCSIHLHMGRLWRYNSAGYVLKHLELLVSKYDVRHFHFEDDNLTLDISRFKKMLDGMISKKMKITWDTPNGIRVDAMTKEELRDCKKSGCIYLVFGIESGDQKVLDKIIEKRLDLNKAIQAAAWCKEVSLDAKAFYVIGFPGETKESMKKTVDFALWLKRRHDVAPSLFVATPLPGTILEKVFLEKGLIKRWLTTQELARMTQGNFLLDGDTFKADDVRGLVKRFYRENKKYFIRNCLLFFMRHPTAILRFFVKLFETKGYKIDKATVLNILAFKNCLQRKL